MLEEVTVETFAPHVGEVFELCLSDTDRLPVTLIAADPLRGSANDAARVPFSLLFRPPAQTQIRQSTYRIVHERIGELDIFLVPVTPDAKGPRLEAIFT